MQEFPKWKYHKTEQAKIVESKAEESALGNEWVDSPAQIQESPVVHQSEETAHTETHEHVEKPKRKTKGK